ncbi:MAG: Orotidine 5'-phosphate decarboxylase [Parcubacteria group bacterium GW2011_GWC2_39_14]|nr:MAG: Orotidine 5'-phosphate decarboxylase [Parcubacteria group bacterium GW2011_GWC2_39_14]KKR54965.1 MAG: Orotidine 5'-phosphate decarboxylase [Parcubacteria group bacterium GW2011_GWA2_40_23]
MKLEPAQALIVAADFAPALCGGAAGLREALFTLVDKLDGTGVTIKVNSLLRCEGVRELIPRLHLKNVQVMADLKLCDIPETMRTDAQILADYNPSIVTVMANAGIEGMMAVREALRPETLVFAVTVLTSLDEDECQSIFGCSTKAGVLRFARMAKLAGLNGIICSGQEAKLIRSRKELDGLLLGTPAIRPEWSLVAGDDQKRPMTPHLAIEAGARFCIVGRPITKADDPRAAAEKTIAEIATAIEDVYVRGR